VSGIYLLRGEGELVEMTERPYSTEDVLQALLAQHPSLLAGDQFSSSTPRRWILVAREMSLPDQEDGGGRWSVDHLFVDQDAVPTLVEVKRSSDTRIRREVVGQMLDYAANAVVYWPVDRLRATFETSCTVRGDNADELVSALLDDPGEVEGFWDAVQTNLRAGNVRLVFVADEIPPELRRVIEFLNVQMNPAEVIGVEIRQIVGEGMRTLVPRVVGQTEEAQQRKSPSGARIPRRTDWSWDLYGSELNVPEERIEIGKALAERIEYDINRRELSWSAVFRKGYVAFQRPTGYNVLVVDMYWARVPRLALLIPEPPTQLGLTTPYPGLTESWDATQRQWGWTIPTLSGVPDISPLFDLAGKVPSGERTDGCRHRRLTLLPGGPSPRLNRRRASPPRSHHGPLDSGGVRFVHWKLLNARGPCISTPAAATDSRIRDPKASKSSRDSPEFRSWWACGGRFGGVGPVFVGFRGC